MNSFHNLILIHIGRSKHPKKRSAYSPYCLVTKQNNNYSRDPNKHNKTSQFSTIYFHEELTNYLEIQHDNKRIK